MKIVTGYRGEAHITANDDQGRNQGIVGSDNYIFYVGGKLAVTASGTSTIQIADGEGMIQGVHFRVEPGTSETLSVTLPSSGNHREDLVVAEYTKNSSTGVEAVTAKIIQGTATPTSMDTVPPTPTDGDILGGDSPVQMVLARVVSNNSGIVSVTQTYGAKPYWKYASSSEMLSDSVDGAVASIQAAIADIATLDDSVSALYTVEGSQITLSNISGDSATKTCRVYKSNAGLACLMLNAQGYVTGTSEVTIGTLPDTVTPATNFFRVCQTNIGKKYYLIVRANRNIAITPIDEIDPTIAGNIPSLTGWYRESITFATT